MAKTATADASGRRLTMGEGDWDRNFIELGLVVGWIFVALRIVFALWLVLIGVRAARSGDPMSLLLASFAALAIFQGQITMHTAYAHLTWFAVGLTMAAARAAWAPGLHKRSEPRRCVRAAEMSVGLRLLNHRFPARLNGGRMAHHRSPH